MNFIHIVSFLILANLGFAESHPIPASRSIFPQFMLSQYYLNRTAAELSAGRLENGEISIFRYLFRSYPERIINRLLEESDDIAGLRNKTGYSLAEVEAIGENAKSEEEKVHARELIGKTPQEVADDLSQKSTINNSERNRILETEQRLLHYDSQTETLEIFLIVPYSIEMVEEIYRQFHKWPKFHSSYRESRILTEDDFKSLPEKFHELKSDANTWYHYYRSKILQFEWSGVNKFQRFEEDIPIPVLYKNSAFSTVTVKRVVLRWELSELFDGSGDDPWDDEEGDENPFENNGVDVSSGYLLLEQYVNTDGTIDPNRTVVLLKYQFRITDLTLSDTKEIPESLRTKTMADFVSVFFTSLKNEITK